MKLILLTIFFIILITYNYTNIEKTTRCQVKNDGVKIVHNAGFFSCCTVRLDCIINYINTYSKLPTYVDSNLLFTMYKKKGRKKKDIIKKDITFTFFENYDNIDIIIPIQTNNALSQFNNYSNINYTETKPIIKKYFSPSNNIIDRKNNIKAKYNIDYSNTIVVYFRGTDKINEIATPKFEDYYSKLKTITDLNSNKKIIIQTDSSPFLDYIKTKQIKNIITFDENKPSYNSKGTHKEKRDRYTEMQDLHAIILIISECNEIICCSNNVSLWIMLFRGHARNVYQYLENNFLN